MRRLQRSVGFVFRYGNRLSRMLFVPAAIALTAMAASASGEPWPSRPIALPLTCPESPTLEPTDGRQYMFVIGALAYSDAFLDVILYTSKASYEMTLPSFKIDRPSERRARALRSAGVLVEAPPGEPFLGASIAGIGTSCGASHAIVLPVDARAATPGSQEQARFLASVQRDAVPTVGAIVPKRVAGSKPPPCQEPFAPAKVHGRASEPEYPDIARQQRAVGTALIELQLDVAGVVTRSETFHSTGNVALDQAALTAATMTVYDPAIFNCRPDAGSYLFEADFTSQ